MKSPLPRRILRIMRAFALCCIHREKAPGVPGLRSLMGATFVGRPAVLSVMDPP
ncbi:hypothetical protein AB0D49_20210 [Streptomyces sp. NPDC048290]|uniref:hypothetical protein n=1 Tax=Streptomyces sp. NPDC048290 TaxID=3155811 RepID=UPI0034321122